MKKMESVLVFILIVFAFGLAGCGTTPSPTLTPSEMVNLESPLYVVEGENNVEGFLDFCEELKFLYRPVGLLGGYPLTEVGEYLEMAKECNSILIFPPIPEGIQEFQFLQSKYPDLCPLSSAELEIKLESYSFPLLYFSIQANMIRGIIITEEVGPSLAELLSKGIPLDMPFRYKDGQLILLE